jgi:apolipoprotein N-acyltransferase
MMITRKTLFYVSPAIFGLLQWAAWPSGGFAPLLFVSWVILFYAEDFVLQNGLSKKKLFFIVYAAFFLWNLLTTWWIYNSSAFGAGAAILCNSLFMALIFMLYHNTRIAIPNLIGRFTLLPYWIAFEYLHHQWDLSWPWLSLGNGLASYHHWIQWYEFTGMQGGTFWILWVNILIYQAITTTTKPNLLPKSVLASLALVLPVILSLMMYYGYKETGKAVNVVVVQPNVDPYHEKFNGTGSSQLERMLRLAESKMDSTVELVVLPETALPDGIWENDMERHPQIERIRKFLSKHNHVSILFGATTLRFYEKGEKISATARKLKSEEGYYDVYNTALMLSSSDAHLQVYHKSKLVPGVEKMPYPAVFGFLEKFAIDLGGMSGSHGTDPEPKVFKTKSGFNVAPVICYESIYNDYLRLYVNKGAEMIGIITNDGWWGNTPGHRQHLDYAKISSVSLRRAAARSANTGISAFINQRGDVLAPTAYWQEDVIKEKIYLNESKTYFARFGNFIASAALVFSAALILLLMIKAGKSSFNQKPKAV